MWFKIISITLGFVSFLVGIGVLLNPNGFFGWLKKLCEGDQWSNTIKIGIALGSVLMVLTAYAVLFHYVAYGWILAAYMGLGAIKYVWIIFWPQHARKTFLKILAWSQSHQPVYAIMVLGVGGFFLFLGLFVY